MDKYDFRERQLEKFLGIYEQIRKNKEYYDEETYYALMERIAKKTQNILLKIH